MPGVKLQPQIPQFLDPALLQRFVLEVRTLHLHPIAKVGEVIVALASAGIASPMRRKGQLPGLGLIEFKLLEHARPVVYFLDPFQGDESQDALSLIAVSGRPPEGTLGHALEIPQQPLGPEVTQLVVRQLDSAALLEPLEEVGRELAEVRMSVIPGRRRREADVQVSVLGSKLEQLHHVMVPILLPRKLPWQSQILELLEPVTPFSHRSRFHLGLLHIHPVS
mmetsp:Transcript_30965/g.56718  ORF Transcript_30965/g.56718 Transcript_30965/m.56718 type:complete len:222 (+) Transcript_30965:889-1554(+)